MIASLENSLSAWSHYHKAELTDANKLTSDILESYLQSAQQGAGYILYEDPLGEISGIQAPVPVLLAEYPFHDIKDVDTYRYKRCRYISLTLILYPGLLQLSDLLRKGEGR